MSNIVVVGGGAAGVFAAIVAKQHYPDSGVILLEKSAVLLSKVRISGGGRCNVTHSCFDPKVLISHYPRGGQELLGPFHRFQPKDTIDWFESRGVLLKTEDDGRIFPSTDRSQSIIDCLLKEASECGVEIRFRQKIHSINKISEEFHIQLEQGESLSCKSLILATGNSKDGYQWAEALGHTIVPPVPSLFTFNVPTSVLKELSGVCVGNVKVQLGNTSFKQVGNLLITHFGFSGPAVLKLSAWAARHLYEKNYQEDVYLNWVYPLTQQEVYQKLLEVKRVKSHKGLLTENLFSLPKSLWQFFLEFLGDAGCLGIIKKRLADVPLHTLEALASKLCKDCYQIEGKTTHKEEFVTCGGIELKEVNFKTMESKKCQGLFFAGEVLNIDGVTGGFNFQNAWTTGYIAGTMSLSTRV